MSTVYVQQGEEREAFIGKVFRQFDIQRIAGGKTVLLKPNIVSHEHYPTTTHPETVEACLRLLQGVAKKIIVADGPAWDAGDPETIIEAHPLGKSCAKYGIEMADLLSGGARKVEMQGYELEVAELAFRCDLIISLPVLKSHGICGLTGALKNQLGLVSVADKKRLHYGLDVHRVIAELNEVIKPCLYIVDAVHTRTITNEERHGGKTGKLGYMLAGSDPVSLDSLGLELLAKVEPRLRGKSPGDILHIKYAADMSIGAMHFDVFEL